MTEPLVTDAEKTFAFLAKMYSDIRDIKQQVSNNILDVDEWFSATNPSTVFRPQKNYRLPIVVEYILAIYPATTESAVITLGERNIPIVTAPTIYTVPGQGSVPTPAANATVAATTLVAQSGLYTCAWTVGIEGVAATLADNMKLTNNGVLIVESENGTAIGDYPQETQTLYVTAGTAVAIHATATEATATYSGQLTLTLQNASAQGNSVFTADTRIQLEYEDDRYMTISPGGPGYFGIMGRATSRERDRP